METLQALDEVLNAFKDARNVVKTSFAGLLNGVSAIRQVGEITDESDTLLPGFAIYLREIEETVSDAWDILNQVNSSVVEAHKELYVSEAEEVDTTD